MATGSAASSASDPLRSAQSRSHIRRSCIAYPPISPLDAPADAPTAMRTTAITITSAAGLVEIGPTWAASERGHRASNRRMPIPGQQVAITAARRAARSQTTAGTALPSLRPSCTEAARGSAAAASDAATTSMKPETVDVADAAAAAAAASYMSELATAASQHRSPRAAGSRRAIADAPAS